MMKEISEEEKAAEVINTVGKVIMALIWLVPGVLIAAVIRIFSYPTQFSSLSDVLIQYAPWLGLGGALGMAFAWFLPNLSGVILEMILGIEFTKE